MSSEIAAIGSPPHHLLPSSMLALLVQPLLFLFFSSFFSSVISENSTLLCPAPLSPLQQLASSANQQQQYPTCSLSSRPVPEPAPEFLSFEEWKAKQLAAAAAEGATAREKEAGSSTSNPPASSPDVPPNNEVVRKSKRKNVPEQGSLLEGGNGGINVSPAVAASASSSPRSHIPLIDRFNYASNECNARIHSSHKSAKSVSSILSRKKDRYMLSPCQTSKESQFVIVELCEDIRIDTVQLANFEFFSGIFKDIRVSVAHAYTSDGKGWVAVGDYTAKNTRGVQSFHPTKELLPFYRYIRIDFLSYYGSEYFCPVSLLRVYGLTQMEEWKSDVWKAEWEASQAPSVVSSVPEPPVIILEGRSPPVPNAASTKVLAHKDSTKASELGVVHQQDSTEGEDSVSAPAIEPSGAEAIISPVTSTSTREIPPIVKIPSDIPSATAVEPFAAMTASRNTGETIPPSEAESVRSPPSTTANEASSTPALSQDPTTTQLSARADESSSNTTLTQQPDAFASLAVKLEGAPREPHTVTQIVSTTIVLSAATPSPSVQNGESIYRMIINRLNMLEGNQTLYARYVEEQGRMVNARLERMEEDIGRLGGIVTLQQLHVAKMLEKHRAELQLEHGELVSKVENLAHEVLMEKRLGVVQLVLLVTVLVFMGLTRGSREEPLRLSRASAAWNRGVKSSGDWVAGWRSSRISDPDVIAAANHRQSNGDQSLPLQSAFVSRPSNPRLDSMERRPRRSSSQRPEVDYDELFGTPPRPSRQPTRSRRTSRHGSRSRNLTPIRALASLPMGEDKEHQDYDGLGIGILQPSANSNVQIRSSSGSGANQPTYTQQKGHAHKRTNSGGTGSYWRAGRSISLTGLKGPGTSTAVSSTGRPIGPTRRLAKTAHMHEVKPATPRSATMSSTGGDSEPQQPTSDGLLNPGRTGLLPMLSPMMEDPLSAGLFGFGDARPRHDKEQENSSRRNSSGPIRVGGFNPEVPAVQSDGAVSDLLTPAFTTSSSGMGRSIRTDSGMGVPFPSPAIDIDDGNDIWVDDEEENEAEIRAKYGGPSSSPTRAKKSNSAFGFSLGSPRRSFVFASSPPGTRRFKKRSDAGSGASP